MATLPNQNQKQGRFRSLEEALKALDVAALQKELDKSLRACSLETHPYG